ncbi:Uncharacterised protein [Kurthia zopfii]|uniref:Uncharacterized protein n=1 Tax=Kurthia zopfii TaxID=1650 RepID=A0A8B4QA13_9BACL|nr:hypothetical protein DFR61_11318 [Kurthia zopfii]STX09560.1 Uncharacterised protein [Kurthia zopfii]VEI06744.1 Uncharacterised protein [Kurthia zopfii]
MLLFGSTPTWFFIIAFAVIILFVIFSEFLTRK